ncbi:MAG: glycosyltransferase family 61 protein [Alphaproteobacteria bacterium]|nr:glycosyltransferase family 61 protein [Alphaproteobacteria bacterium]
MPNPNGGLFVRLYMPDEYQSHYKNILDSAVLRDDLDITDVPNGFVAVDRWRGTFGAYDAARHFVPQSTSYRYTAAHRQKIPRRICLRHASHINGTAIYCGKDMSFHFGHFLLEGLTRIWPILNQQYSNAKLVFAHSDGADVPEFVTRLLYLAGVCPENVIIANKSVHCSRLIIPRQSFCIGMYSSPAYGTVLRRIADNARGGKTYDKIYLSRAKMGERKTYGEEHIQKIFARNGYTIIYPETLSVEEQIYIAAHCTHMAGCAGSALHLAAFMKPGGTVIQLKRNRGSDDNMGTQHLINKTAGLNFIVIWASVEERPTAHFTPCPQIIGVTEHMRCFFDDAGFVYDAVDIAPDMTAHAEYNMAMEQYLARRGSNASRRVRGALIKICAAFVPIPPVRRRVRSFLKRALGIVE